MLRCVRLLLDAGADITLKNSKGQTAKDIAVLIGNEIAALIDVNISCQDLWIIVSRPLLELIFIFCHSYSLTPPEDRKSLLSALHVPSKMRLNLFMHTNV